MLMVKKKTIILKCLFLIFSKNNFKRGSIYHILCHNFVKYEKSRTVLFLIKRDKLFDGQGC